MDQTRKQFVTLPKKNTSRKHRRSYTWKLRQNICKEEIDAFVIKLLENISDSGHEALPIVVPKGTRKTKKNTAGWKEYVEPY